MEISEFCNVTLAKHVSVHAPTHLMLCLGYFNLSTHVLMCVSRENNLGNTENIFRGPRDSIIGREGAYLACSKPRFNFWYPILSPTATGSDLSAEVRVK